MKKLCVNRTIMIILAIALPMALIPISSACTLLKLTFKDIVICSGIDGKTGKPLDEKTVFEAASENIFATIRFDNAKGDDNYRFKWTNLDSGEIVLDVVDKYNMDKKGIFITDIINSKISSKDFPSKLIASGNYKVEYYHNGEVVKTTTFKVNKPIQKINEISLANQIDEKDTPINKTKKFYANETVYACIKFDTQNIGNNVKAKWKSSTDELLYESGIDMAVDNPGPSYITFKYPEIPGLIPAGRYKVEIYLNDNLYGSLDFEVTAETTETTAAVAGSLATFNDGNTFTEGQSKYYFTIQYPDNWEYILGEENGGLNLVFNSLNKEETYYTVMLVTNVKEGLIVKESDIQVAAERTAKTYVQSFGGDMQQVGDTVIIDYTLLDGTPFKSYVCYFIDNSSANKDEYAAIIDIIPKFDKLYIWTGLAPKIFYNQLDAAYLGALETLVLKK